MSPFDSSLSEAEAQVLASLHEAESNGTPSDRASLEAGGERYWIFQEDWSSAYPALLEKGLITGDDAGYALTEAGRPQAEAIYALKPDLYWYYYRKFYPAAWASETHSELCRRAFGEDLCQEGQADMANIERVIEAMNLGPGKTALDLGCGAGGIATYIARQTGAAVTGLDYADTAIAEASARAKGQSEDLSFIQGDFNALDTSLGPFDAIYSIDTLYWVADMEKTLTDLKSLLKPGGRMAIFMNSHQGADTPPEDRKVEKAWLFGALSKLGFSFETEDWTQNLWDFWVRNHAAAKDLKPRLEAEGNGFIADSLIREAEDEFLPGIESGLIQRYFYLVRT